MNKRYLYLSLLCTAFGQNLCAQRSPNIILIMCDDMGFSDLSCYGGEIQTPNIDMLANNGMRFSNFKNTGRSCPSRASLLTGRYPHEVGMGWMTAVDEYRPGYRGEISRDYPTVAEIMRDKGYNTYMNGKWHVTVETAFYEPDGSFPTQRGFDKYYGCLSGGGSYYKPKPLYSDMTLVTEWPEDYYYTTAITNSAVSFIRSHNVDKPMFMYIAHFAPHRPLHAPKDRIERCKERYKVGYDKLREQRFDKLKSMGFFDKDIPLPIHEREFNGKRPAWTELTTEQQERWTTEMATYAAMIEIMDDGIGEVIQAIREKGMTDETIFLFLSDNGATNEGDLLTQLEADLSNTPYRSYKQWCFQGGTSAPLIISSLGKKRNISVNTICDYPAHIIDILPTCLGFADAHYPSQFKNHKINNPDGESLLPLLKGGKLPSRPLYFEHQTSCGIIDDGWKLVRSNGRQPWELINLSEDPFEIHDLANQYPKRVKALEKKWTRWAKQQPVFPFEYRPWSERIKYYKHN